MSIPRTQHWDPDQYARHGRFVSDLAMPVVELLSPQPGEQILDLGCGDGTLTAHLLTFGCTVLAVDASPAMVAAAKSRGINAQVMDGQCLPFENQFDAVFSNAALHWMPDPKMVADAVWRALKAGGRFVGELGAAGNVSRITMALESAISARGIAVTNPWYFPTVEEYARLLTGRGFSVCTLERLPRPTLLPGDMKSWLVTFAQPYLVALPDSQRETVLDDVIEALRSALLKPEGRWYADYVRLRFLARKLENSRGI